MSEDIKLGRVGHYCETGAETCETAIVTKVWPQDFDTERKIPLYVNLTVFDEDGVARPARLVPTDVVVDHEVFHLNRSCPWER